MVENVLAMCVKALLQVCVCVCIYIHRKRKRDKLCHVPHILIHFIIVITVIIYYNTSLFIVTFRK